MCVGVWVGRWMCVCGEGEGGRREEGERRVCVCGGEREEGGGGGEGGVSETPLSRPLIFAGMGARHSNLKNQKNRILS